PLGAHHYRHTRAPDCLDGRRHPPLRAGGRRPGAQSQVREIGFSRRQSMQFKGLAASLVVLAGLTAGSVSALAADPENTMVITLKDGDVTVALRPDLAPKHVEQIKKLVREHAYDNVAFHRVIDGFMAQTGHVQFGRS